MESGLCQFPSAVRGELPVIDVFAEGGAEYRMDDGGVGKFAQKAAEGDKRMLVGNKGMIQVKVPLPFLIVQDRATDNLL